MLDGGHLRAHLKRSNLPFNPDYIEKVARACHLPDEDLYRVLYYDCAPYAGSALLPVSGRKHQFSSNDRWLCELAEKDLFAVRRGVLKFRGYVLAKIPFTPAGPLQDSDFKPTF